MSEEKQFPLNKLLAGLLAVLSIVTAVQGYYLYRMWHKSEANVAHASEASAPGKDWSVAANKSVSIPLDISFKRSFDPGSWDPWKEMEEMQKQMDRMFDQAFSRFGASPRFNSLVSDSPFSPKSDIEENDREYIVRVDVPGTDASKIDATLQDQTLTISGVRQEEVSEQAPGKPLRQERRQGRFERIVTFPTPVKQQGMKTEYKDGVLTITIPKEDAKISAPQSMVF